MQVNCDCIRKCGDGNDSRLSSSCSSCAYQSPQRDLEDLGIWSGSVPMQTHRTSRWMVASKYTHSNSPPAHPLETLWLPFHLRGTNSAAIQLRSLASMIRISETASKEGKHTNEICGISGSVSMEGWRSSGIVVGNIDKSPAADVIIRPPSLSSGPTPVVVLFAFCEGRMGWSVGDKHRSTTGLRDTPSSVQVYRGKRVRGCIHCRCSELAAEWSL